MTGLHLTPSQRLPALLIAVVALWALIFCVAALAGLGGRYGVHPDDPSRIPPLPALDLSQARSPLQPVETYADIGERPLFNPDRKPVPIEEDQGGEAASEEPVVPPTPLDIAVTSIIMTPQVKIAIITDNRSGKSQSLKIGDVLEGEQSGWKLAELEARKAVFTGPGGASSVDLRVFDGAGGQAPTPAPVVQAQEVRGDDGVPQVAEQGAAPAETGKVEAMTPEARAEMIRRRIEERRRQMREEAERANNR
ncbi:hypothetical protein OS176_03615 [Xanthomonadaceae bacterium XH05]|nr:hypothetical protein [Xanthomonadaceae bacterium XH05]